MIATRDKLRDGWYGGVDSMGKEHTACDCNKLVEHCTKEAQAGLDADTVLSGNLKIKIIVANEDEIDANEVDVSQEGGEDPDFNDTLFVEDDCDECEEVDMEY